MDQRDREERQLEDDYQVGRITLTEYNRLMRDLNRDYRESAQGAAEDAAHEAYERELDRW